MGEKLTINWRYFSLEQVNSKEGPGWKVWEQPADYVSRGLPAFMAAEAARKQGRTAFARFHFALLRARHEEKRDIADIGTLCEVAGSVGLDMSRFQKDVTDRRSLARLAEDHTFAVENLFVFGTPTLVFPKRQAVFVKLSSLPPPEECLSFFEELYQMAGQRRYVQEVKRL